LTPVSLVLRFPRNGEDGILPTVNAGLDFHVSGLSFLYSIFKPATRCFSSTAGIRCLRSHVDFFHIHCASLRPGIHALIRDACLTDLLSSRAGARSAFKGVLSSRFFSPCVSPSFPRICAEMKLRSKVIQLGVADRVVVDSTAYWSHTSSIPSFLFFLVPLPRPCVLEQLIPNKDTFQSA